MRRYVKSPSEPRRSSESRGNEEFWGQKPHNNYGGEQVPDPRRGSSYEGFLGADTTQSTSERLDSGRHSRRRPDASGRSHAARWEENNTDDRHHTAEWGHGYNEGPAHWRDDGWNPGYEAHQNHWDEEHLDMSQYSQGLSGTFSRFPPSGSMQAPDSYGAHLRAPDVNHSGKGPKNYQRRDESIYEDICRRLTQRQQWNLSDVAVTVKDGDVTLTGTIESREDKRAISDEVAAIRGVRDVNNKLILKA